MRESPAHPLFVLYDGWCPLCQRTVRVLRRLDWLRRLKPVDFRRVDLPAFNARYGLNLTLEALDKEMYVVRRGRPFAGFDGYRVLLAALPLGWLMVPWLYLPGMLALGRWLYGVIARNRPKLLYCDDHCAVPHAAAAGADDRTRMVRDLDALAGRTYDVVVVGGGIYGACAAWEATLRGLSVALVEQIDFGHATSANSQKIVHGGLRYLQSFDVPRMRESIRERRTLLRIAPHLVRPLPCLVPTYGFGKRSRIAMRAGLLINDLVSWDRNAGLLDPAQCLPAGRIISRDECLRLAPGVAQEGLTGGALWYDGQITDTERLTLSIMRSAASAGACVANYIRVTGFLLEGNRIVGVEAEDVPTGQTLRIRGQIVLNTAGPWCERVLSTLNGRTPWQRPVRFLKAMNLVTRRIGPDVGLGLGIRSRTTRTPGLLFMTPWSGRSVIGTAYAVYAGDPERCEATEEEVDALIRDINEAYATARLTRRDVCFVHVGLLPAAGPSTVHLERRYRVMDHARRDGLEGLISVLGVKYTTARDVAEKAVALACRKLGSAARPRGASRTTPLFGGEMKRVDALLAEAIKERGTLSKEAIQRLVLRYGLAYRALLALARENLTWLEPVDARLPVLKVEVVYAVREEMAQTLNDVVFRRTGLGSAGHPGERPLRVCADLLATELGWDAARRDAELSRTEAVFHRHGAGGRLP